MEDRRADENNDQTPERSFFFCLFPFCHQLSLSLCLSPLLYYLSADIWWEMIAAKGASIGRGMK